MYVCIHCNKSKCEVCHDCEDAMFGSRKLLNLNNGAIQICTYCLREIVDSYFLKKAKRACEEIERKIKEQEEAHVLLS